MSSGPDRFTSGGASSRWRWFTGLQMVGNLICVGGIDILTTAGTYYPILSPLFVLCPSYGFDSTVPNTLTRECPGTTRTVHLIAFVSGFVGNASDVYPHRLA